MFTYTEILENVETHCQHLQTYTKFTQPYDLASFGKNRPENSPANEHRQRHFEF